MSTILLTNHFRRSSLSLLSTTIRVKETACIDLTINRELKEKEQQQKIINQYIDDSTTTPNTHAFTDVDYNNKALLDLILPPVPPKSTKLALKIRKQFAHQAFGNFPPEDFPSSNELRPASPPLHERKMGGPTATSNPATSSSGHHPEGQTYCLRWNNHKSNLIEILDALIKVESYVDCTIVVDDQVQFKAHRVVLAANSPYFQSILQDMPMDHCSIIFPGVKAFEMRALLEYMYTGEVNVTQSQIPKIMRIAEELEVKGLFDMADLKEKFHKLSEEHAERAANNPYANSTAPSNPYSSVTTSSAAGTPQTSSNKHQDNENYHHNSSSVISTSSNISPSAAPSSSSSPPYNSYKSPYASLYSKSPAGNASQSNNSPAQSSQQTPNASSAAAAERSGQWSGMSPSAAAAAAMLSSVYESAPDMNPLKRKKLSSISSMLMNRDTPILRNVLAQANPADSSQPMPLMMPTNGKGEKMSSTPNSMEKNNSFNGSDYSNDKLKYPDEPHSPYTDRSFEDESFDQKGNYANNFGGNGGNQKPEWKRYKQYTRNDIMSAIQCVRDGMSALQASRKFGVPSRTLYDKVKKLGITTGRPMNRTMKRSPSNVESTAAFPFAHGYGQAAAAAAMHEAAAREEREMKEHHRNSEHHHMASAIPHPAAALLDPAFLQQALENRGGDIAGREALHAMALAAAAHAAANRMSASPGPNGNAVRSPSPSNFGMKYGANMRNAVEQEFLERHEMEREREREMEREREREMEREEEEEAQERRRRRRNSEDEPRGNEEDDHVEDLSLARKDAHTPIESGRPRSESPFSPTTTNNAEDKSVIMSTKIPNTPTESDSFIHESNLKREVIIDDVRAD
ncbi:broad-complex core protein [Musca vetustissima]|uniref:broad-complex core protein n=1 Tax=Musca vetustissima TaxID=27455 RepID=UPI002AB7A988|nr:broad-complex core protein [Musca vetustissima]